MSITLIEAIASAYTKHIRPAMNEDRPADDAAIESLLQAAGWCPRISHAGDKGPIQSPPDAMNPLPWGETDLERGLPSIFQNEKTGPASQFESGGDAVSVLLNNNEILEFIHVCENLD